MNARQKGKSGEYEVMHMLQEVCDDIFAEFRVVAPRLRRNAMAYADGGEDIVGLPWYAFEVKRVETLAVGKWWVQCLQQAQSKAPGIEECGQWDLMPDYFSSRGEAPVDRRAFGMDVCERAMYMVKAQGIGQGGFKPVGAGGFPGQVGLARAIPSRVPVLLYRQSRKQWQVVSNVHLTAWAPEGTAPVRLRTVGELSVEAWLQWFRVDLRLRLGFLFPNPPATPG